MFPTILPAYDVHPYTVRPRKRCFTRGQNGIFMVPMTRNPHRSNDSPVSPRVPVAPVARKPILSGVEKCIFPGSRIRKPHDSNDCQEPTALAEVFSGSRDADSDTFGGQKVHSLMVLWDRNRTVPTISFVRERIRPSQDGGPGIETDGFGGPKPHFRYFQGSRSAFPGSRTKSEPHDSNDSVHSRAHMPIPDGRQDRKNRWFHGSETAFSMFPGVEKRIPDGSLCRPREVL